MKAYIKIELQFFETPQYVEMREKEGCMGEGCTLELMRYLRTCPDGIGYVAAIRNIAHICQKSKKYLTHIVTDYDVFRVLDNGLFCCPYMMNIFKKGTENNDKDVTKTQTILEQNPDNTHTKLQNYTSQLIDNQHSLYYKNNKNNENEENDKNNPTTKCARNAAADDFKNNNSEIQKNIEGENTDVMHQKTQQPLKGNVQKLKDDKKNEMYAQKHEDGATNSCCLSDKSHDIVAVSAEAVRKKNEEQERAILNNLYEDAAYMHSVEALTELYVYRNESTRYYALQWFRLVRHSQGKPLINLDDAKRHFIFLLRKGRKTREEFHRWHNDQLERM